MFVNMYDAMHTRISCSIYLEICNVHQTNFNVHIFKRSFLQPVLIAKCNLFLYKYLRNVYIIAPITSNLLQSISSYKIRLHCSYTILKGCLTWEIATSYLRRALVIYLITVQ